MTTLTRIEKEDRIYLHQTGKLGVWIPKMEASAKAGEFSQPHSSWRWTGAELYVLPSGKIVHHQGDWSAVDGEEDTETVTVFANAREAFAAAERGGDMGHFDPAVCYLSELLEGAGVIDQMETLS